MEGRRRLLGMSIAELSRRSRVDAKRLWRVLNGERVMAADIELLNIAGTGPILGLIQGAHFGPVAFITIPVGCVIAGAFHDYMVGMISIRNRGGQTPDLIRLFLGPKVYHVKPEVRGSIPLMLHQVFAGQKPIISDFKDSRHHPFS